MIADRTKENLRIELSQSFLAKAGVLLLVLILTAAVFAPLLAPHDPTDTDTERATLPPLGFSTVENETVSETQDGEIEIVEREVTVNATTEHPLGTDSVGRDVLSRMLFGARTSLLVGLIGTGIAVGIGVSVGMVAGYFGGRVDDVLMRSADIMLAFPSLVLAVALVGLLGTQAVEIPDPFVAAGITPEMPGSIVLPGTVIIVIALVNWVWFARVARGEALSVRNEEYVKAARSLGGSDSHILRRHVLPNSITPILVLATIQIAAVILLESALSFLGFSGANLSWGLDIAEGRDYLSSAWWIATMPGIAIVLAVVSINLIGDWLRDALDPDVDQGEGGV